MVITVVSPFREHLGGRTDMLRWQETKDRFAELLPKSFMQHNGNSQKRKEFE